MHKQDKIAIISIALEILTGCKDVKKLSEDDLILIFDKLLDIFPEVMKELTERELALFFEEHLFKIDSILKKNKSEKTAVLLRQYFALSDFEADLNRIESKINSIETGDHEALDKCASEFRHFIKRNEKRNPDFIKQFGDRINEIYGDLMAIGSKGKFGSIRKTAKMEGEIK